jgi:hypothetical protein
MHNNDQEHSTCLYSRLVGQVDFRQLAQSARKTGLWYVWSAALSQAKSESSR